MGVVFYLKLNSVYRKDLFVMDEMEPQMVVTAAVTSNVYDNLFNCNRNCFNIVIIRFCSS